MNFTSAAESAYVSYEDNQSISFHPALSDAFQFGRLWTHIRALAQDEKLTPLILERKKEIKRQKETWKDFIECRKKEDEIYFQIEQMLVQGLLDRADEGYGAAYFFKKQVGRKSLRD